jgi:hypothetical protein
LDEDSLTRFYDERMQAGDKKMSSWNLWWHSHGHLDSYFSHTDQTTINDWDNLSEKNNWLLSMVANKRQETHIRLDVFSPIRITVEDIPFELSFQDTKLEAEIQAEVDEKVIPFRNRPKPPTPPLLVPGGDLSQTTLTFDPKGKLIPDSQPLILSGQTGVKS